MGVGLTPRALVVEESDGKCIVLIHSMWIHIIVHLLPLDDAMEAADFKKLKERLLLDLHEDVEIHHFRGHFSNLSFEEQVETLSLLQTLLDVSTAPAPPPP